MKTFLFLAIIISAGFSASGQSPARVFTHYRDSIPAEKIYMHFDKQAYAAGETAWFKAYLFSPGSSVQASTNFFAELVNEKGEVIASKKLPVLQGKTISSQFDIPVTAEQGVYIVRGWTNYTPQYNHTYSFKKALPVFNASDKSIPMSAGQGFIFQWFPESGKLLNGVGNILAYRCTTKDQKPVAMTGKLYNSRNEMLGDFATNKYGVGYFSFPPVKGEKYYAELLFPDETKEKTDLPAASDDGAVLSVTDHDQGKIFSIQTSPADAGAPKQVQLLAVLNNEIVLKTDIEIINNIAEGLVNTEKLDEGILRIYVFDKGNNLLAQRAAYISSENNRAPVEFSTIQKSAGPKGLNEWRFVLPKNTTGSFSVSVTDAGNELAGKNEEGIFNSLLFQPGRSHFSNVQVKDEEIRDQLMLTGSWFDDNWPLFSGMKAARFNEEYHLPFKGKIYEHGKSKLITDGQLSILVKTKDSSAREYSVPVMKDGSFKFYELIFEDTARIYYRWSGNNREKLFATDLEIEKESLNYPGFFKDINSDSWVSSKKHLLGNPDAQTLAAKLAADIKNDELYKGKIPETVVVNTETSKTGGTKEVNKRYATGSFSSLSSSKVTDLVSEPPSQITGNIFDYIVGKMGGFTIEKAGGRYTIYSSRSTSTQEALRGNSRGLVSGKVFLDEQETSTDMIARIPLEQIALVKYFAPGSITLPGVGLSCVLAVYTRKPEDMGRSVQGYTGSILFAGYESSRQFYSPDYSTDDKKRKDNRNTLYWNPDIKPAEESNEIKISFYNSDNAKKFRVVLEGITSDGKLVSFEKVVE